jgi:WD40 repeat protein
VRLWSVEGTLLHILEGHTDWVYGASFSSDGQRIASASADRTVRLWSIEGKPLQTLEGHTDRVFGVSFSPDGQRIASASADRTVRLWSVEGKLLRTLEGHTDAVYGVSFSLGGQRIASASYDRTVKIGDVDPDDLILDLDIKLNNLLKKGCLWIRDYLKTNPNVGENDRNLCDNIGIRLGF